MATPLRVLLLEDSDVDAELTLRALQGADYLLTVRRVDTSAAFSQALDADAWDLILSDHSMPQFSSLDALHIAMDRGVDVPFIIVSGTISEGAAVDVMRAGARDYILKKDLVRLPAAVRREMLEAEVRREALRKQREAEEKYRHLAFHDPLTGLPNRISLVAQLESAVEHARSESKPLALLRLSLDRFRDINNTLGHQNGEVALREVAQRLLGLAGIQVVCRLGAAEFAVLASATDLEGARRIAQKVTEALELPLVLSGLPIEVGTSIGIAMYPGHGEDPDALMRCADVALDRARQSIDASVLYSKEQDPYDPRRLQLMGELRTAIESSGLSLEYQPKIELESGRVVGVEALVRWSHPELGSVRPDEFVAIAEESSLIRPLTRWVLNEALRQCRTWRQRGIEICVSVNLSARNLQESDLAAQIEGLLETWGVAPEWIVLEITESAIMVEPNRARLLLDRLSERGLRISIDDFGTGYSSLAYLRRLPVSEMKIDRSFVIGLSSNQGDLTIVRTVVGLGHHLGLKVVAEGVEDAKTWDLLAAAGCDMAQGYYMARPMSAADFSGWLRTTNYGVVVPAKEPTEDLES